MVLVNDHTAMLFGGKGGGGRFNDAQFLDPHDAELRVVAADRVRVRARAEARLWSVRRGRKGVRARRAGIIS